MCPKTATSSVDTGGHHHPPREFLHQETSPSKDYANGHEYRSFIDVPTSAVVRLCGAWHAASQLPLANFRLTKHGWHQNVVGSREPRGDKSSEMDPDREKSEQIDNLLHTPDLADALDSQYFKRFLDQIPIGLAIARLDGTEQIEYANPKFEDLTGIASKDLSGRDWGSLQAEPAAGRENARISDAIKQSHDFVGTFRFPSASGHALVDVYSNIIQNDNGSESFRLVALVDVTAHGEGQREVLEHRIREKDLLLRELQHRVKNNLQMITALIRLEARSGPKPDTSAFEKLAGRVNSLVLLYEVLSQHDHDNDEVDLAVYLGKIASAVMASHAKEGITLDMKLVSYTLAINVAMPSGLVVNELLTNCLKHAFPDRDNGTITLQSEVDGDSCRLVVADDGIGLPLGETWPQRGKLGELIVQSLRENANAEFEVSSKPGCGTTVTIIFRKSDTS